MHGNLFIGTRLTIFKLTDIKPNLTFHLATFQCWHERLSNSAYLRTVVVAFFERHCPQIIAWFDMNSSSASNSIAQLIKLPRSPNDALDNISGLQIMFFLFYGGLYKTALLNHHLPPETKRATQNLHGISDNLNCNIYWYLLLSQWVSRI